MKNRIFVKQSDMDRLRPIVENRIPANQEERENLLRLEEELDRAEVVSDKSRTNFVTMHSEVRLQDLDTREVKHYRLVYPGERIPGADCVSVLAPIGTALLGYQTGDTIVWRVPKGTRRLKVLSIVTPPTAAAV